MPHSPRRRAQLEPIAALAAVLAVTTVLGIYAGVFTATTAQPSSAAPIEPTLQRVVHTLSNGGVVDPARLTDSVLAPVVPVQILLNVTLRTDEAQWTIGPTPPPEAARATRPVPVTVERTVTIGRIRVVVWT